MHDFTLSRARNTIHSVLLALGSLALPACPMNDEEPGDTTGSETASETTGKSDDSSASEPDDTTSDKTTTESADTTDPANTTTDPADTTTDATTGAATYTLSGTVGRTVDFAPANDGIGTLFVAAFAECGLGQSLLGVAVIPAADLSAADARVAFSLPGLPAGPVHLGLFLDDNGDADPMGPLPHDGDLVYGFDACDGELDCVALEIADADLVDVALDLNLLEVDECP